MRGMKRNRLVLGIGIPILAIALLLGGCLIYLESYYPADAEAVEAFAAVRTVAEITLENGDTAYDPGDAHTGLIFYPGGKVDGTAYAPLMRAIAADGVLCVLCRMPFRLAVFDLHAADSVREAYTDVEHWYIGGHSLGGVIASKELAKHRDVYDGLLLLGSYSTEDLSMEPIRALLIYGSEDCVMDRDQFEQNRKNLPEDSTEIVIEGGCHAYFGMYGRQRGDGTPTVSNEEQIRTAASEIRTWIRENGGAYAENP